MAYKRIARVVLINVGILLALWMGLLFATSAISDVFRMARSLSSSPPERAALPNYPDHAYAAKIYKNARKAVDHYVPYVEWRRGPLSTETLNIDADGLRMHTVGRNNNDATASSIGFFGGSTMWGTGVDDNGTIPAIFDQLTTTYEVTNYGESGYTTRQSLEMLINLMNENKAPKTVIFYSGVNDVQILCNKGFTSSVNGHHEEQHLQEMVSERQKRKTTSQIYLYLVKPIIEAFGPGGDVVEGQGEYVCARDKAKAEAVAETLVRGWEIAHQLVASYDGRFFAFLQPVAFIGHPRLDHLKLKRDAAADFLAVYPLIRARLAARGDDWATDISDTFDRDEYIYVDSVHVSRNGNALVAARIRDRIAAAPGSAATP
jgi:hypothetical protein